MCTDGKRGKMIDIMRGHLGGENIVICREDIPTIVDDLIAELNKTEEIDMTGVFVSGCCKGVVCDVCGEPATDKLGEEIQYDDPHQDRHNLTAYVCKKHFKMIVG